MRLAWITLAQVGLLAACSGSHMADRERDSGMPEDAGPRVGPDGGRGRDSGPEGVDAGAAPALCRPADARAKSCPDLLCDGPGTWHWNGDECFWIDCGACEGTECSGPTSREECEAAHATCDAVLCRDTGGTWKFWAEECEHYTCGRPGPAICESGMAVCDCGPFSRFQNGVGCVMDPTCPIPEMTTPDALCRATGGEWGGFCCHSECGERCLDACVAPACDCGPQRVFDEDRGCIEHERCFLRSTGQTCSPRGRCENGGLCCERCGGIGCTGPATCQPPVCDSDDRTDLCGNRLDAP